MIAVLRVTAALRVIAAEAAGVIAVMRVLMTEVTA